MLSSDEHDSSASTAPRSQDLKNRTLSLYRRYEAYAPAAFFIGGFVFDIVTLSRIDDTFTLIQQGVYLALIGVFLFFELLDTERPLIIPRRLIKVWEYRELIIHFLFGSLLSVYTLFYFKGSSFVGSLLFLSLMAGVMIANEFERFQKGGVLIRSVLLSLCLTSYFAYLIPIMMGFIGAGPFLLAIATTLTIGALIHLTLQRTLKRRPQGKPFYAALLVQFTFVALYFLHFIPPVPLSAPYMGVYHQVEKADGHYQALYYRPSWKFWERGSQTFLARPGDRIYLFARIFSPEGFREQIRVRWLYNDSKQGWVGADTIPLDTSGGRDEGFRGFAFKQNYTPGDWRVQLETTDGREIARLSFTVITDTSVETREPKKDIF